MFPYAVGVSIVLILVILFFVIRSVVRLNRRIERFMLTERDELARRDPYQVLMEETLTKGDPFPSLPWKKRGKE